MKNLSKMLVAGVLGLSMAAFAAPESKPVDSSASKAPVAMKKEVKSSHAATPAKSPAVVSGDAAKSDAKAAPAKATKKSTKAKKDKAATSTTPAPQGRTPSAKTALRK